MKNFLAFVLLATAFAAHGHGGEDHDAAPSPPPSQRATPSAAADTNDFELVAVLQEKKLVVYVDRFASNEPVAKAKVEVEGAGIKGLAAETAPGTYVLDLAALLAPAKYPLTFSIEAGEAADLVSATLDTSQPLAADAHRHGWSEWVVWTAAGAVLLAAGLLFAMRRHRRGGKGL